MWDGTVKAHRLTAPSAISIHPSRVGWDQRDARRRNERADFNPPIPCGMGPSRQSDHQAHQYFNPPIPCGMGLRSRLGVPIRKEFQSTHPVWDGTSVIRSWFPATLYFNPPIPCGMGLYLKTCFFCNFAFQSTHPVWDGTATLAAVHALAVISIHPSRVGWDLAAIDSAAAATISIHPSRVGWDFII